MKGFNIKIIAMVLSTLLFIAMVGLMVFMRDIDRQTEETSTFYIGTVSSVDIQNTGDDTYFEIHTKEYSTSLYISTSVSKSIVTDDVTALTNGQIIFFSIENAKVHQMNQVQFLNVTSLKTDTKDIFSLDMYNTCIHDAARPARIASVILALSFLSISLFCLIKIRKEGKAGTV